jgi:hypothetical protein
MSCYMRHLLDLFAEAGLEDTKQNRKAAHAALHSALELPEAHCPELWHEIKVWRDDPALRAKLVEALAAVNRA